MESSAFDIHAKRYDSWYDNNPAVYASEMAAIRQLIPSRISKHCIEIGVGTGRFASELGIAYGLDPSGRMMQIARTRAVECIQGAGEALPLKDSSMELALMVTCFCLRDIRLTLFSHMNMIREAEKPEEGFGKGSFVSIRAKCIKKV